MDIIMFFQVLLVSIYLLFGAPSVIGHRVDCANDHSAAFELKKVLVNGTLFLDVTTDHNQAHVLVQKVSSDGDKTPIISVNADPNSVPNLTFWGVLGIKYANRISVYRTATKPGEPQYIRITIRSVKHDDAGTYSVEVENAHSKTKKCFQVYVHGPPMISQLVLVRGDCSSAEGSCARLICMGNSTTTPRNSDVPLRYTYSINGSSPDVDSKSRYMVQNNELMIGGLTKADDNLKVTCEVQEENGHPKKVSTTYTLSILPYDLASKPGTKGQQRSDNSDDDTFLERKDCANNHGAAFELKKVLINGTLLLDVKTDHNQAHVMVQKVSSGGDKTPIMSVNADPNITFWDSLGMDYKNRTSVNRTATKPGEPQYIGFAVRAVEHEDAGTYSVEVENAHSKTKKCFHVYVHGPPTTPKLVLVSGDCSYTEGSCARFICISNLTTTPRNPDVPLRYTYSINGSSPDVDSDSRYMMQNNELMIGGLTKADDNLIVTCEVQEENGHPKKVSTTYTLSVLPSDPSSELGTIGRQSLENSDDGTLVAMKGTEGSNAGWIAGIVVLSVLLTASGIAHAVKYCKGNKQSRPLGTAGEPRKLNKTELDAPGSFSVP